MNARISFQVAAALALLLTATVSAADLAKLKVLYIGDTDIPRAREVTDFLKTNVAKVDSVARNEFQPAQANPYDVVILDWPQSERTEQERKQPCPLGERSQWTKPTVLLGSAGLNLAFVWKLRGGAG